VDIGNFSQKTKVRNGEVIEEKSGAAVSVAPSPSFSKFLIIGVLIGAVIKWYR